MRWCLPPLFAEPRRFLETSRVTHKHAQKTGRSRAARTRRTAFFYHRSTAAARGRNAPTVNFPGAPLASVLAALPDLPSPPPPPPPAPPAPAPPPPGAPRRSGRAPAPKVIFDAPDERSPSQKRRKRPLEAGVHGRKRVEGAQQKQNGKWKYPAMFPGREFDDLDELRAAKKQRKERRAAYSVQANAHDKRRN